jgi:two-component system, cell cycle sensor histidine kinase and response regulator CckA
MGSHRSGALGRSLLRAPRHVCSPGEEIARIKSVAIRGSEIVRELMIYAGEDQALQAEPVDLSQLVEEMLGLMKFSISKQVVLKINLGENLPPVLGNGAQIRQVVMNLVINASEAIGDKVGVIHVSTSHATRGPGSAASDASNPPTGDSVRLEVSDTGRGMTEEAKAKIFDPFFTTKFAGRGLGLAVVRGIVRDHGGMLDVVSAPGRGATFQVLLPCTSKKVFQVKDTVKSYVSERSGARKGTVLVVEDEEVLRLAVSKALRKRGFSVVDASDGSEAMNLLRTQKDEINVILLDVTLPGVSSREILDGIQRTAAHVKVVLTSAYSKQHVDSTLAGLRITNFIRKPFQLDELAGVLRDAQSA